MNNTNRVIIVLVAAAWIVLMAVIVFLTWTSDADVVDRLGDFVEYLDAHRTDSGRLIVTLAALATAILALLVIIVEFAPEDEVKELRIEQAGATTIVPADALRMRLEEALAALPEVQAARSRVKTKEKGIFAELDLTLDPSANAANVTQEAIRVVVDTIQTDLGLPVAGVPVVRIAFGAPRPQAVPPSIAQRPSVMPENPPPVQEVETVDERVTPAQDSTPGASPGPLVYDEAPPVAPAEEAPPESPPAEPPAAPEERRGW